MLEVGNLQASIKSNFNYYLIMKEVTDFLKKNKMDRSISYWLHTHSYRYTYAFQLFEHIRQIQPADFEIDEAYRRITIEGHVAYH